MKLWLTLERLWLWREDGNSKTGIWDRRWTGFLQGSSKSEKKKRQEHYLSVMWQSLITLTHHQSRDSLKCLLHWASGRNRSKMTAVRSIPVESEADLYTDTPETGLPWITVFSHSGCDLTILKAVLSGYIMALDSCNIARKEKMTAEKGLEDVIIYRVTGGNKYCRLKEKGTWYLKRVNICSPLLYAYWQRQTEI